MRPSLIGWALYDWANSPFTTLIISFVFAAYFSRGIVGDELQGQVLWGYAIGASSLIIAILSPLLGAIADAGGRRKPWILVFSGICITCSALLWLSEPNPDLIMLTILLVIMGNIGFELGIVFNNAMLGSLVREVHIGRLSGWAWGLGYFGGLFALLIVLFFFIRPEEPTFGLSKENAANIRIVGPFVAIWFGVFLIPLLMFTQDEPKTKLSIYERARGGIFSLRTTLSKLVRNQSNLARFLLARMLYNDGLVVIFALGGVYAAGKFNMGQADLIYFGILLNIASGLGAIAFAWFDDWLGSKVVIIIALIGLILSATGAIAVSNQAWFWVWGAILGIFVGPAQAASRSFMVHLTSRENRAEFFGLFALSGKATAFMGPLLAAQVTNISGNQSLGLGTSIFFFLTGLILLLTVNVPHTD